MKRIKLAVLMCLLIGIFVGIDIYEYNTYADSFIEIAGMEELINIAVSRDTATPEEIANAKVLTYKEDATTVYEFLVDCVITHNLSIDTGETVKFKGCKDVNFEYDDNTKIAAYDGIKLYGKFSANRFFTVTNSSIVYVEDLIFDGTNAQSFIWSTHYSEYFVNSAATLNFDDCLFTNFKLRTDVYFSTIIRSVSSATTNINNCNFYSNEVDDIMYASIIEFQGTKNNTLQNTNFYKCKAAFGIETYRKSTSNNIKVVDCELRLVYYIKASSQYSCTISNLEVYNSVLNEVLDSNENTTMTNINIHDNQIEAVLFSTWQYTTTSQRTLTLKNVIAKKNNNNNFISVCYGNAVLDGIIDTDSNRMDVGYNGDETITFKNDVNIVNYPVSLNVLKDVPGAIRIIYEDETELDINNFNCIDEVYNDNVFGVRKEVVNNKGVLKQTRKFTEDLVGDDISNLWYDGTSLEFSTQILNRDIILELNEYYAQWKEGYYDTEANGYAYKSNDKRASISEFISVIGGTDFEICCNDVENILFGIVEFDENGNVIKRTESLKGGDVLTLQSLTCNVSMFIYNQADNLYDGTGSDDKEIEKVALWARMQFRKDLLVSVKFTTGALNPWGNYLGKAKITGYKDNIYAGPAKILFEAENEYILGELERQFYIVCDINDDIEARILKIQGGTNEYLMYSGGRVLDKDDFVLGQEFESSGVKKISVDCGEVDIENEDYFCGEKTLILEEKIIYISQSNTNNGKTNVEIIDMPEKVHVDVQDIYDNVIGESIIEVNIDEKSKNDIEENVKDVVEQKTKNKEMLGVYDINITRTDNMVDKQEQNLLSKTLVTLSIPASQKYDMCEVYHIKDDGKVVEESVEEITYANEKLTIKFYTESFSTFIIVTPKAKSDVPVFKPDKNVEPGNSYMTITMIQHEAIIEGYDDKTYRPNDNVTREQVAALFARLDSDYNDKVDYAQYIKNNGINDVKTDTWSSNYIGYMIKKGIMNTVSKGKFMPDKPCTRAEIVKIICSFKKFNANGYECEFDDAKGTWYEQYVSILVEKGFIDGYEDGMFKGEKNVTRAEIAKLITIMENRTLENTSRITNSMITTIKNKYRDLDENAWYFPYVFELAYDHSVQLIH